ncbi:V-type proton ATPase subunit e 2 [Drosophila tropicalis]|uniref:V-type proton ATPase subunit e 2 n=1 Tax=Drosophila tropicalis TaxID=46794 RepID=UPI0035ABE236
MGANILTILVFTGFWALVGIVGPILVPKSPHHNLIRCILMLTAASCWLFWFCCYLAQMNPFFGPKLEWRTIAMIAKSWDSPIKEG